MENCRTNWEERELNRGREILKIFAFLLMLVSSSAFAQTPPTLTPGIAAAMLQFVCTIENGGYASYVSTTPVLSWAPLNTAEDTYFANPTALPSYSGSDPTYSSLEYSLVTELQGFADYWALAGSSASLFDPFNRYLDSPTHIAFYTVFDIVNVQNVLTPAELAAPEIDPSSAIAAMTLLLGGLLVLRGRRPMKLDSAAA